MVARRTDSTTELAAMVAEDPQLQRQVRDDPVATLRNLAEPLDTDPWIYRIVVGTLGLVAILVIVGIIILQLVHKSATVPDAMVAIGSASIAALAALLVPGGVHRK
jgi:hypothetical protein